MNAVLCDSLGYEVHRVNLQIPPPDVLIWGEVAYVRAPEHDDPKKPTELVYIERKTRIVVETPASGIYRRSDLDG